MSGGTPPQGAIGDLNRLQAMLQIARDLTLSADRIDQVAETAATAALGLVAGARQALVFLAQPESDRFVLRGQAGRGPSAAVSEFSLVSDVGEQLRVATEPAVWRGPDQVGALLVQLNLTECVEAHTEGRRIEGLIALPLRTGERSLGFLVILCAEVCSDAEIRAKTEDLGVLAKQAALALSRALDYYQLQRTVSIHEGLARSVLHRRGLQETVAVLARHLGRTVVLEDDGFTLLACHPPVHPVPFTPRWLLEDAEFRDRVVQMQQTGSPERLARSLAERLCPRMIIPVRSGEEVLGYLSILEDERPLDESDCKMVQRAATVFALELLWRSSIAEAEQLLTGGERLPVGLQQEEGLVRRAALQGYEQKRQYVVLVVRIDRFAEYLVEHKPSPTTVLTIKRRLRDAVQHCLSNEWQGSLVLGPNTESIIVVLAFGGEVQRAVTQSRARVAAGRMQAEAQARLTGLTVSVGIGRPCNDLADLPASHRDAVKVLHGAAALWGPSQVAAYDDLGTSRLLLQVGDPVELDRFAERILGRLIEHEGGTDGVLMETLRAYAAQNRQLTRTAEALFVHVNTLGYRLQRVQEIAQLDLDTGEDWLNVQLALRILQLRGR